MQSYFLLEIRGSFVARSVVCLFHFDSLAATIAFASIQLLLGALPTLMTLP